MEHMIKVMRTSLLLCMISMSISGLRAEAYCSLKVKVLSTIGDPVLVVVEEVDGSKTESETVRGEAAFCGLGIRPVSVTVGHPGCNQAVVRDVLLVWNKTTLLSVIYDPADCLGGHVPVAACAILFRFVSEGRLPVKGVSVALSRPFPEVHAADDYGRTLVRIVAGQRLSGSASAPGYLPLDLDIECVSKNSRVEQVLILEKRKTQPGVGEPR